MRSILKFDEAFEAGLILFGAKAPSPQPTTLGTVILGVALIVAVVVGWRSWQEAHEEEAADSPEDLLASFEEAHAAGEIDDDEIKRLRAKLTGTSAPFANPKPEQRESEGPA